jgi:hypothetical protein
MSDLFACARIYSLAKYLMSESGPFDVRRDAAMCRELKDKRHCADIADQAMMTQSAYG